MTRIKLVVSDIDGTFLGPDKKISSAAVHAVEALHRQDIHFTFITGRPRFAAQRLAGELALDMPVVACNGALIFQGDTTYFRRTFPLSPLEPFLTAAHQDGLTVIYSLNDIEYAAAPTHWTQEHIAAGRDIHYRPLVKEDWGCLQVEKVNVFAREDGSGFSPLVPYIRALQHTHAVSLFGFTGCEIVASTMNKSTGLRELCRLLGCSMEQVLAIGDNDNDIEMLHDAGIGCAVQNAADATKHAADYVCSGSYGDGVVEAIHRFALEAGSGDTYE